MRDPWMVNKEIRSKEKSRDLQYCIILKYSLLIGQKKNHVILENCIILKYSHLIGRIKNHVILENRTLKTGYWLLLSLVHFEINPLSKWWNLCKPWLKWWNLGVGMVANYTIIIGILISRSLWCVILEW